MMIFKIKYLLLILFFNQLISAQISGVQLFNPQTNDETSIIKLGENLILRFDDFSNASTVYRYTLKHLDRNWQDDNLFFTEYADGSMNGEIEDYKYSFNTVQKYTHYTLSFPNEKLRPKISGNYELIVYKDSAEKPILTEKFSIYEDGAVIGLNISRFADSRMPNLNQRIEVSATGNSGNFASNLSSMTLKVQQNNNRGLSVSDLKPTSQTGNQLLFQQPDLAFPGNSDFFYFDNKIIDKPFDMVAGAENKDGFNYTYLHPVLAYPLNYQSNMDTNGAYYFRRSDMGIERNPETEADYSRVFFALDSDKMSKEIFVLGDFNDYQPSKENQMFYDENSKKYIAKIYLKQGFYNYILATKDADGVLNFGEINGNFWQTQNLYQALLYYTPFGKNYDGLLGYGESRPVVR